MRLDRRAAIYNGQGPSCPLDDGPGGVDRPWPRQGFGLPQVGCRLVGGALLHGPILLAIRMEAAGIEPAASGLSGGHPTAETLCSRPCCPYGASEGARKKFAADRIFLDEGFG